MGCKIAIFTLNQWALDFDGNTRRIIESIKQAQDVGAIYRAGPELEVCGYSLEDALYESDTLEHCWTCLQQILEFTKNIEMIIDIGMPVHFSALFNCRVICHRGQIVCIRAKTSLAREGCYREPRYFKAWPKHKGIAFMRVPIQGQSSGCMVPIGADFILELYDKSYTLREPLKIGWDICQELWDIKNSSSSLYSDFGCHIVINGSASYWELRKLETINDMIKGISLRSGACYAFSNLIGCDGQRYVFSGRSCIYDHGKLVGMTSSSSAMLDELEMITHTIYPEKINEYRASLGIQLDLNNLTHSSEHINSGQCKTSKRLSLDIDTNLCRSSRLQKSSASKLNLDLDLNPKIRFELEIRNYVSLWLWDYLRRSNTRGFIIPLSGGLDSSTVAILVYCMCNMIYERRDSIHIKEYFARCLNKPVDLLGDELSSARKICSLILRCRYLSTQFSGQETLDRATRLSKAIGADFERVSIDELYGKSKELVGRDQLKQVGLLEQNIQARLRMAMTYYLSEGNRIVLATGNVDEGIMGYLTKYDCSSADINPIGGLCKSDLRSFLRFCQSDLFQDDEELVKVIGDISDAPPSAELTGSEQRDEEEIGITYDEISVIGRVRRGALGCSGPKGAFENVWRNRYNPPFSTHVRCLRTSNKTDHQVAQELAALIKRFFQRYCNNRHKLTVLTPALHAETYSPDDNRFDHRQFLYPPLAMQFRAIDELVTMIGENKYTA